MRYRIEVHNMQRTSDHNDSYLKMSYTRFDLESAKHTMANIQLGTNECAILLNGRGEELDRREMR